MRTSRIILGLIGVLFCLTLLLPAARRFLEWEQIRSGQVFYVQAGYLQEGVHWLIWGLVALIPIVYASLRPRSSPGWLILGFSVALVGMAALPSSYGASIARHRGSVPERLLGAGDLVQQWGARHGRFPASQAELDDALRSLPQPSPFARAGRDLPYLPVFAGVSGAAATVIRPGDQPGMLLYATSPDQRDCWLTVEALGENTVATQPVLLEKPEGGPWVVEQKMAPAPPAPPAKPPVRKPKTPRRRVPAAPG